MPRRREEDAIQHSIFQHYRARAAPGTFMFAVPNGGYRRPIEAKILKGLGVVAGVPDVFCIMDGSVYALELKAKGGQPTKTQIAAIESIRAAGGYAAVVYGLDNALRWLEAAGILRGQVT